MDTLIETLIEFYKTYTLNDLYTFIQNFDIIVLLSNWGALFGIVVVVALLFSPIKSWATTFLMYVFTAAAFFIAIVVLKNSTLSQKESFIFFGGSILSMVGFSVYKYLIRS